MISRTHWINKDSRTHWRTRTSRTQRITRISRTHRRARTSRICRRTKISRANKFNYRPASPTTDQPVQLQTSQSNYRPASPTTDQPVQLQTKIYSQAGSMNRATGDLEQLKCGYRGELDYPATSVFSRGS